MCWIKIHRGLLEWEWHDIPEMMSFWMHLLLLANYEDKEWHGQVIPRGSFVTNHQALATTAGISLKQARTCMARLEKTGEVTLKRAGNYTIVTISAFNTYQLENLEEGRQRVGKGQAKGSITRSKEEKKEVISISKDISITKKESPAPAKKEYAQRVHLTDKEHDTLVSKYGEEATSWMIDKLSAYKVSRNKSYSSDYAAINNWVVDRLRETQARQPARGQRMFNNSDVTEYHDGVI